MQPKTANSNSDKYWIGANPTKSAQSIHSATKCDFPKISRSNGRQLNGIIIDLIYYAFSGGQSEAGL